jgi:hypothetical protein
MERTRRWALKATGGAAVAAIAGCTARAGGGPAVETRVEVSEDGYAQFPFETDEPATLSYEVAVEEGPLIDVLLVHERDGRDLFVGESVAYIGAGSALSVREASVEYDLDPGGYLLVVDNSPGGRARPPGGYRNDRATVTISYTVG